MENWPVISVGSGGGGGGVPTLPTVYILQYCSIVDVVPHLCPLTEGNHSFVV